MTQKIDDEATLVTRLQNRDKKAFEQLYERYSGALYGISLKIIQDEQLAGDVLQEAFVKIWKHINSYSRKKGRLFTWMLNITRNTAIDALRKQRTASKIQSTGDRVHLEEKGPRTTTNIDIIGVEDMVHKLKPAHRVVIDAVYFSDLTHKEAAEALGLPLGTLKTRVRAALKELKRIYNR